MSTETTDLASLEQIDDAMDDALDEGDTVTYRELNSQRDKLVAQLDADEQAGAAKIAEADRKEQAKAVEGSAAQQVATMKVNLHLAERQRAELDPGGDTLERANVSAERSPS